MLDIRFYMECDNIFKSIQNGKLHTKEEVYAALERIRDCDNPVVYNIETTNRCNMRCQMCPRTTMMTRPIEDIDRETFLKVVNQIHPHSHQLWQKWKIYCENKYGIYEEDKPSENHFFLYVIAKVIQLHGYGDPLLDKNMYEYIQILHDRGLCSYFSCNPSNINLESTYRMLDAGVDYIKYSIESTDDEEFRSIRGKASNFTSSYQDILKVLEYKQKNHLSTTIVITMLNLNRVTQKEDYEKLRRAFDGLDVYIYLKSEDCQWYRKDYHGTDSIHWSEPCKHPWMTMTIKSNGDVAMCMEDFNNEIVFGNVKETSLKDIWNGERYQNFRWQHLEGADGIKCSHQCDMLLLGDSQLYYSKKLHRCLLNEKEF